MNIKVENSVISIPINVEDDIEQRPLSTGETSSGEGDFTLTDVTSQNNSYSSSSERVHANLNYPKMHGSSFSKTAESDNRDCTILLRCSSSFPDFAGWTVGEKSGR